MQKEGRGGRIEITEGREEERQGRVNKERKFEKT